MFKVVLVYFLKVSCDYHLYSSCGSSSLSTCPWYFGSSAASICIWVEDHYVVTMAS